VQPGTALVHLGTGLASTVQVPMVTATTRTGSADAPAAVLSVGSVGVSAHVVAGLEARVG
jgi:hypothetical protein